MLEKVTGVLSSAKEKKENIANNLSENTGHGKDREVTEGQIFFFLKTVHRVARVSVHVSMNTRLSPSGPVINVVACPGCEP